MFLIYLALTLTSYLVVGKPIDVNDSTEGPIVGESLGVHVTDNEGRIPRSGCSSDCVFPFLYLGTTYDGCTNADHDQLWCATDTNIAGEVDTWVNCDQACSNTGCVCSGWLDSRGFGECDLEPWCYITENAGCDDRSLFQGRWTSDIACSNSKPLVHCESNQFACSDGLGCIRMDWKCDGEYDCSDRSDENGCPVQVEQLVVDTSYGPVQGRIVSSPSSSPYLAWEGVPYAAPPTGGLRWRPPQAAEPWEEVHNATLPGSPCVALKDGHIVGSEDCLFINIYSPTGSTDGLPVMVWTHGGGLVWSRGDFYRPDLLMETEEVILVTFNFRLGALGFMAIENEVSGNQGLQDQIFALEWVSKNIGAFGGDPNKVTLFGQGSGSWMVGYMLVSPLSRGLFHGAILQGMVHWEGPSFYTSSRQRASEQGVEFATDLGCLDIECLGSISAGEIMKAGDRIFNGSLPLIYIDGIVVPQAPSVLIANGLYNRVPLIIGATTGEGIGLAYSPLPSDLDNVGSSVDIWLQMLTTPTSAGPKILSGDTESFCLKNLALKLMEYYFNGNVVGARHEAMVDLVTDAFCWVPTTRLAGLLAAQTPVFYYIIDALDDTVVPWTPPSFERLMNFLGIPPPKDSQFYLGLYPTDITAWSNEAKATSSAMIKIWTSFAKGASSMNSDTLEFNWGQGVWPRANVETRGRVQPQPVDRYLNISSGVYPRVVESRDTAYADRIQFWRYAMWIC